MSSPIHKTLSFRRPSRDFAPALRKFLNGNSARRAGWQRLTLDWPIAALLAAHSWEYLTDGLYGTSGPLWHHCLAAGVAAHTAAARRPDRERLSAFVAGLLTACDLLPLFVLEADGWAWDPRAGTPLRACLEPAQSPVVVLRKGSGSLSQGIAKYLAHTGNDWVRSVIMEARHGG